MVMTFKTCLKTALIKKKLYSTHEIAELETGGTVGNTRFTMRLDEISMLNECAQVFGIIKI